MYGEDNLDAEGGALLDRERLILEGVDGSGSGHVDDHVGASLNLQGQGLDDALSGVVGVTGGFAGVQAEGGLPAVEGFVVLVCGNTRVSII